MCENFSIFLHHPRLMIYCFYINLLILILLSIFIFYYGISLDFSLQNTENDNYCFGIGFPYILSGVWGILINVGGMVGMRNKDIFLLSLNYLGLIYGGIFSLISIVQIIIINDNQGLKNSEIMQNICLFIIILIPLIFGVILASIYKVIFQKDLKSYMA